MMRKEDYQLAFKTITKNHFSIDSLQRIASEKYHVKFVVDDENRETINLLLNYFMGSSKSKLELDKGICLIGSVGTGKTLLMGILRELASLYYNALFYKGSVFNELSKDLLMYGMYELTKQKLYDLMRVNNQEVGIRPNDEVQALKEILNKSDFATKILDIVENRFDESISYLNNFEMYEARYIIRAFEKYKYSLFDKDNTNMKELLTDNICIDDLGLENKYAIHWGKPIDIMSEILLDRYNLFGKLKTHMITNLGIDELSDRYSDRIISRFRQMMNVVYLDGIDRRC